MNIFQLFDVKIKKLILSEEFAQGIDIDKKTLDRINIEIPRDSSHGDISTNAALILCKKFSSSARDVALKIITLLKKDKDVSEVIIAGPGFINIKLKENFWHRQLISILKGGLNYGKIDLSGGAPINIEYVSANPTGPMHVGHCRGAVVGDVLANLLEFAGYKITREYYINDAGSQINILAQSVLLRYREALGEKIDTIPEGYYPGEYLIPLGEKLAKQYNTSLLHNANKIDIIKDFAVAEMMAMIKDDLAALNIKHDVFFSERELHKESSKKIRDAITDLTLKGFIYTGILEAPKGHEDEEWESREQVLFRSTEAGDDQDRALVKSDGSFTYFSADVAYFRDKLKRNFKEMIYILGADHSGYVKRLKALALAFTGSQDGISVLLCQLVKLMRNGEPIKMSKRAGNFVTLRDVVNEVGCDPVRFMMIYRKNDAPLDFDFAKVTEQSKDNPVFYVQYAVARCHSIFRQAELGNEDLTQYVHKITSESELAIIKKMAAFPQLIKAAVKHREPHRLAFYLYDLASLFHTQWSKGNEERSLRFIIKNDREATLGKLALVKSVCNILTIGLNIIKVNSPESMD